MPRRRSAVQRGSARSREIPERVFHALSLSRREHKSLTEAARVAGTTRRTVLSHVPKAWEKQSGRWHPTPSDTYPRRQVTLIIGPGGGPLLALVETRSSRQASVIGEHDADIGIVTSVRSTPEAREEARTRLEARHGNRAGPRATLADDSTIRDPRFYGVATEIADQATELDLGDIDYGSSASRESLR